MSQIIDLSKTIQYHAKEPFFMRIKVTKKPRWQAKLLMWFLGMPYRLFPKNFKGWADETIRLGVHSTTHIDAPWHYAPQMANGIKSPTIDQIPLEYCFGEGVVIDMKHKADFEEITQNDIQTFLKTQNISLKAGQIVLIKTGRDCLSGTSDIFKKGTGMSAKATHWLIDQGIKVMGIDQWGWDLPLPYQIRLAKKHNDQNVFWNAHLVGYDKEYWHMEQLCNLDALPYTGFRVGVFPLKIKGASAAPARVVAFLGE